MAEAPSHANDFRDMPNHLLYSTNPKIKLLINELYRNDTHYVWCGDCYDSKKSSAFSSSSLAAPSSDPFAIYCQLRSDVKAADRHSAKIQAQKLSLTALAAEWLAAGEITKEQAEDMTYLVSNADFSYWVPLLYVIPTAKVADRLHTVAANQRASLAVAEYIISDLHRSEFDILELAA